MLDWITCGGQHDSGLKALYFLTGVGWLLKGHPARKLLLYNVVSFSNIEHISLMLSLWGKKSVCNWASMTHVWNQAFKQHSRLRKWVIPVRVLNSVVASSLNLTADNHIKFAIETLCPVHQQMLVLRIAMLGLFFKMHCKIADCLITSNNACSLVYFHYVPFKSVTVLLWSNSVLLYKEYIVSFSRCLKVFVLKSHVFMLNTGNVCNPRFNTLFPCNTATVIYSCI